MNGSLLFEGCAYIHPSIHVFAEVENTVKTMLQLKSPPFQIELHYARATSFLKSRLKAFQK